MVLVFSLSQQIHAYSLVKGWRTYFGTTPAQTVAPVVSGVQPSTPVQNSGSVVTTQVSVPVVATQIPTSSVSTPSARGLCKYLPSCVSKANSGLSGLIATYPKTAVLFTAVITILIIKALDKVEEEDVVF